MSAAGDHSYLGAFEPGFASWSRVLANSVNDSVRLKNFENLAAEVVSYVGKGLDRTIAVDELYALAEEQGLIEDAGVDQIETIVNKAFEPPPEEPKTNGANGAAPHEAYDEQARWEPEQTSEPVSVPLAWLGMSTWDDVDPPIRRWSILNRSPANQVGLFSGEGGAGKSIIELTKNVAHVMGKDWLGSLPEPGPAFYLGAEDDPDELHRRLAAITKHYAVTFKELINNGLYVLCLFGEDAALCVANRKGRVETTKLYQQLYEAAGDIKPKNISIDTLTRAFAGNELDRNQVHEFATYMQRLAYVTDGGCVTILSHPSLAGIASGSGLSGSTAWHNAFRFRHYLNSSKQPEEDDAPKNSNVRELEFKKNQYGPMSETVVLTYRDGLFLPVAAQSPLDKLAREAKVDELFISSLQRFADDGRNVGESLKAHNYAPRLFAAEPEAKKERISEAEFGDAMRRLFAAKKIRVEQYGRPSKPYYRLVRI
jgi:RecA-family ATPase